MRSKGDWCEMKSQEGGWCLLRYSIFAQQPRLSPKRGNVAATATRNMPDRIHSSKEHSQPKLQRTDRVGLINYTNPIT